MLQQLKIDRIKFHKESNAYFLAKPLSDFLIYNNALQWEKPENYTLYTNISGIDTVIVKVGTGLITHDDSKRTIYNMRCISEDLTKLKKTGLNVLLITSGAIGLGRKARLRKKEKIPEAEKNTPQQKRLDAIEGQFLLYNFWMHHFYPQPVKEFLVTHEDISNKQKNEKLLRAYQNSFFRDEIPIINEDDAKSLEEINILLKGERVFRDNDGLASLHTQFLKKAGYSPLLIILSNTDGIYTAESFKSKEYTPIRIVKNSTGLEEQASPISSTRGRGGVISKIEAARDASIDGIYVVIANGQYCNHDASYQRQIPDSKRRYRVLESILNSEVVGTRFLPAAD